MRPGSVDIYYVHTDHLNSPKRITRSTDNTIVWRWSSDPFGNGFVDQDPDGDGQGFVYNLRLPGQYGDVETGLNYNYQRDYDPAVGRYLEPDPIGQRALLLFANTVSIAHRGYWNKLYAYADDDPVLIRDPTGLSGIWDFFKEKTPEAVTEKNVAAALAALCITKNCKKARSYTSDPNNLYGECASIVAQWVREQGPAVIAALGGITGDGGQGAISECAELCGAGIKASSCCTKGKQ